MEKAILDNPLLYRRPTSARCEGDAGDDEIWPRWLSLYEVFETVGISLGMELA